LNTYLIEILDGDLQETLQKSHGNKIILPTGIANIKRAKIYTLLKLPFIIKYLYPIEYISY